MSISRIPIPQPVRCATNRLRHWTVRRRFHLSYRRPRQYGPGQILPNAPNEEASVAILGGGITGLVCAYRLNKERPDLKISLFEGSDRLGGWLQSTSVNVGTGKVVFEQGPRTLRPKWPNGYLTLDLIDELEMSDRMLSTSKSSPAAQNRYIYYPDHLVRMPGPGLTIWGNLKNLATEPIFNGLLKGLWADIRKPKRSRDVQDESVGSFISRRFSPAIADNVVSALFHGIYAGDIYKLSARSILPLPWFYEAQMDSVLTGMLLTMHKGLRPVFQTETERHVFTAMQGPQRTYSSKVREAIRSSVYTFKGGIKELANQLVQELAGNPDVSFNMKTMVKEVGMDGYGRNAKMKVITQDSRNDPKTKRPREFSHVISTISAKVLSDIVSDRTKLPSLSKTRAVTVMVVNLFYSNPSLLPARGFGYLLPRSLPLHQNPERALGVIFDSEASVGQDTVPGTKLTVMLGGHWWDDFDQLPNEAEGAQMARKVLERHLGITDTPLVVLATLQPQCIPQYEVGHDQNMAQASRELDAFEGRLRVAGSSYTGVGLNDCVAAGTLAALDLTWGRNPTGLDAFGKKKIMSWMEN